MLPLVVAAFGGIGITRLVLLALELHDDEEAARRLQQEQQGDQEQEEEDDPERAKARILWEMARRRKPAKLIARNDCQYVCLWEDGDLNPDLSVEGLLRACAQRQYRQQQELQQQQQQQQQEEEREREAAAAALRCLGEGAAGPSFFQRALADMTAFFDQLAVGRALEPLVKPPTSAAGGLSRSGSSASMLERALPSSPSLGDLLQEPAVALLRGAMHRRRRAASATQQEQEEGQTAAGYGHYHQDEEVEAATEEGGGCCVVCYEAPRDAVFLTCGHGGTCLGCAVDVYRASGECPLCRAQIDQIVTVGPREVVPGSGGGLVVAEVRGPALCV